MRVDWGWCLGHSQWACMVIQFTPALVSQCWMRFDRDRWRGSIRCLGGRVIPSRRGEGNPCRILDEAENDSMQAMPSQGIAWDHPLPLAGYCMESPSPPRTPVITRSPQVTPAPNPTPYPYPYSDSVCPALPWGKRGRGRGKEGDDITPTPAATLVCPTLPFN